MNVAHTETRRVSRLVQIGAGKVEHVGLVGHCKISYFCSAGTVRQLQDFEEE